MRRPVRFSFGLYTGQFLKNPIFKLQTVAKFNYRNLLHACQTTSLEFFEPKLSIIGPLRYIKRSLSALHKRFDYLKID